MARRHAGAFFYKPALAAAEQLSYNAPRAGQGERFVQKESTKTQCTYPLTVYQRGAGGVAERGESFQE